MNIAKFQNEFDLSAPLGIAWSGDNIGLLIGRDKDSIGNVLVALDVTMDVAKEAQQKKINCIVTHHPLIFHPLRTITSNSRVGNLVLYLIEHNIHVYAAHTNLDSVKWGVNFAMASALGLNEVRILSPIKGSMTKIIVFVPNDYVERVSDAMHSAGAGMFSKYDHCSFRSSGEGTFRGMNDAKPFFGKVGNRETTDEVRLEMVAEQWKVGAVISAMLNVHPYEEAAYDIYPLLNKNTEYGIGAIGDLDKEVSQSDFLNRVKKSLSVKAVRYSGKARSIRRVAVCGGSGSDYIGDAVAQKADAMITADLKFHTFQEFEEQLLLIDAGHYETEQVVLPVLAKKIKDIFHRNKHSGKVVITKHSTNPVHIF